MPIVSVNSVCPGCCISGSLRLVSGTGPVEDPPEHREVRSCRHSAPRFETIYVESVGGLRLAPSCAPGRAGGICARGATALISKEPARAFPLPGTARRKDLILVRGRCERAARSRQLLGTSVNRLRRVAIAVALAFEHRGPSGPRGRFESPGHGRPSGPFKNPGHCRRRSRFERIGNSLLHRLTPFQPCCHVVSI